MKNILDTRDLNKRLVELEDSDFDSLDTEEQEELNKLKELRDEIPEWKDGNQLILESYFEDYCKEMLEDCGSIPKDLPWYICIDWGKTSQNIQQDYSPVEYLGETYLYRNF